MSDATVLVLLLTAYPVALYFAIAVLDAGFDR